MGWLRKAARARRDAAAVNVRRICFSHVPKCAGSAIAAAIPREAFPLRERMLFRNFSVALGASEIAASHAGLPPMKLREYVLAYHLALPQYKYAGGHVHCPPSLVERFGHNWAFVTILRDPVDRWISEYVYNRFKVSDWAKNDLPVEEFIDTETAKMSGQTYLRYFSSLDATSPLPTTAHVDEAVTNLARFSVVGTIEHFNEWMARFRQEIGVSLKVPITNISPNKGEADRIKARPELMREITRLCEADIAVYRRIIEAPSLRMSVDHSPRLHSGSVAGHSDQG